MSQTSTTYPHQDLIAKHKIVITELSPKTQALISSFVSEKDEDKKDAIDERIFSDVEDHLEKKEAAEKAAKKKERYAEARKAPAPAEVVVPKKENSFLDFFFKE